ncbi:MAG: PEP-CTERM sorting domain-containing protein, partial [Gammaproteobacteria bacterium]|nr:PEP-CTERM sorting domain-containing protein [Gammaproteobacteria bacterium]
SSLNDDPFICALFSCRGFFAGAGTVEMFEAASPFTPLGNLQDGIAPVVLATLIFDAISIGTSDLSFTGNILGQSSPFNLLGDELGIPLAVLEPGTGSITVVPVAQVPEPGSLLLLLTGLLAMIVRRRAIFANGQQE